MVPPPVPGGVAPPQMPPSFMAPLQTAWERSFGTTAADVITTNTNITATAAAHNTSHVHPVFFSEKLRRPAFGVPAHPPMPLPSPVAHGYVYRDGVDQRGAGKVVGPRL